MFSQKLRFSSAWWAILDLLVLRVNFVDSRFVETINFIFHFIQYTLQCFFCFVWKSCYFLQVKLKLFLRLYRICNYSWITIISTTSINVFFFKPLWKELLGKYLNILLPFYIYLLLHIKIIFITLDASCTC